MTSLRATSMGVMRPPKPPCWRDFVLSSPKSTNSDVAEISEPSGRILGARSPVPDAIETSRVAVSLPGNKPSRLARRPRAKIHRTRSEHVIHAEDLPESAFTATLANADPKGVRGRIVDGRLYVEENNRRCQNWLAGIEAAEPLDKVDYTTDQQTSQTSDQKESKTLINIHNNVAKDNTEISYHSHTENYLIPLYELQQGVDVEVPEETFVWSEAMNTRHKSSSSGEELRSPCRDIVQQEGNQKLSGNPHSVHSSSTLCSKAVVDRVPQSRHCEDYLKCESSSRNFSEKVFKCGKLSCGKKLYKLCCDHEDAGSSSCRENEYPCYLTNSVEASKVHDTHEHNQEDHLCPASSQPLSNTVRERSVSRESTVRKLLTDSELLSLKKSTSD